MKQNHRSILRNMYLQNVDLQGHLVAKSGNVTRKVQIGSVLRHRKKFCF